jgi:uncharacterized cupredoxin-like copper-binding protein
MDSNKPPQTNQLPKIGAGEKSESKSIVGNANPESATPQGRPANISDGDGIDQPNDGKEIKREYFRQRFWKRLFLLGKILFVVAAVATIIQTTVGIRGCQGTERANDISQDTAHKTLQPYLIIEGRFITDNKGPRVRINVKNNGQTPASKTFIECKHTWQKYPQSLQPSGQTQMGDMLVNDGTEVTLSPGDSIHLEHKLDSSHLRALRNRRETLEVSGNVVFTDESGDSQSKHFHFTQGGDFDPSSTIMGAAETGND